MKGKPRSIVVLITILTFAVAVWAQDGPPAVEGIDELRVQLIDVQTREASLRIQAQQLDEDLKPENIKRALAGIGSTKPEELRNYRRRQLTIERERVSGQLKILEISRLRLEAAIASAEAEAYQESAGPLPSPAAQMHVQGSVSLADALMMVPFALFLTVLVAVLVLLVFRSAKICE